ncbi:hypothetical protein BC938DRAFT_480984, partial [Jimgerdemannia flammicorona]
MPGPSNPVGCQSTIAGNAFLGTCFNFWGRGRERRGDCRQGNYHQEGDFVSCRTRHSSRSRTISPCEGRASNRGRVFVGPGLKRFFFFFSMGVERRGNINYS